MSSDVEQVFPGNVVIVLERTYTEHIAHGMHLETVALASASPRRRELLASLGLRVQVVRSAYDEVPLPDLAPAETALRHARAKAAGAAPSEHLIVAADTVVDVDGEALGKPAGVAAARAMLRRLSGRWHVVHTAFALRDDRTAASHAEVVSTRVRFADLEDETIGEYAASGDGLDKAGAYGIQGFAATLVERVDGDYFTVVGFPLARFAQTLPLLGYRLHPPHSEVHA
ncbi:MAG TPA: Maf family protein [Candidatus Cybelea sp.]|jgi:septum formation protein|nr:Maf family protein [Candidatus Cybelea sp.]